MGSDAEEPGAAPWVPDHGGLPALRRAAEACRGCDLWRDATQVVVSAGPSTARLMLIGEQPGDREDLAGEPFVGPAGRLLDEALEAAGIDRGDTYVTNAVKHFRHHREGKRRIHDKPDTGQIVACHPWLNAELAIVRSDVVVCLGATAVRSFFGRPLPVQAQRGRVQEHEGRLVVVTVHPSALLRSRGRPDWDAVFDAFVADLALAATAASEHPPTA